MSDAHPRLHDLSEDECWDLVAGNSVGRLAVSIDNTPDVFPVNYVVDRTGERPTIVIRTAAGLKLAAAVLGRGVAFEVDEVDAASRTGISVVIRGRATEIERLDDLLAAWELEVEPWASGPKNRYLRVEPEVITGRAIAATSGAPAR
ncbi:MAG: pyridoxamine 5'-phosphate oxidase family protein [Actinomycetota bacterium]